jgi:hypothetical protein
VIVGIAILSVALIGSVCVSIKEHKEFSKGNCKCGGNFQTFATDSQNGTGWKCKDCRKILWTSWVNTKKYL